MTYILRLESLRRPAFARATRGCPGLEIVDIAALSVLILASSRGAWLGVVREVFSVAALVAGIAAARWLGPVAGEQVAAMWPAGPGVWVCSLVAGGVLGIATAVVVGLIGRAIKRGLHAAGLGTADRVAGSVLGFAEGVLCVGLLIWLGVAALGRDDPRLADSRAFAAYQEAENWWSSEKTSDRSKARGI